jgi:uncharacterized delta-60 repeat protein
MKNCLSFVLTLASVACLAQISPDATFGVAGNATINLSTGVHIAQKVHQQSDGKLILTSSGAPMSAGYDFKCARFNTNGTIDNTFGVNGVTTVTFGPFSDELRDSKLQSDGKIIIVGFASNGTSVGFVATRLTSTGQLDNTFNGTGTFHSSTVGNSALCVDIQSSGNYVLAGRSSGIAVETITRLTQNGTLDNSFGANGIVSNTIVNASATAMMIDASQNILLGSAPSNSLTFLSRLTPNGALDVSFGGTGNVSLPFTSSANPGIYDIEIQSDGKIVIAVADKTSPVYKSFVARYNPNGTIDNTFNGTGFLALDSLDVPQLTLQPDGKILGVTQKRHFSPGLTIDERYLLRINTNGTFDNSFGTNGLYKDIPIALKFSNDIKLQQDGKIIVSGMSPAGQPLSGISRYNNTLTTNLKNNKVENEFAIYPNPAKDKLFIKHNKNSNIKQCEIQDILGRSIIFIQGEDLSEINTSSLKAGIYFVVINETEKIKLLIEN